MLSLAGSFLGYSQKNVINAIGFILMIQWKGIDDTSRGMPVGYILCLSDKVAQGMYLLYHNNVFNFTLHSTQPKTNNERQRQQQMSTHCQNTNFIIAL